MFSFSFFNETFMCPTAGNCETITLFSECPHIFLEWVSFLYRERTHNIYKVVLIVNSKA